MAEIYHYVPVNQLKDVVGCGLKLSECYDRELDIRPLHEVKKCLSALLNPKDDQRYQDSSWKCVKIDIDSDYCFAADRYLYDLGCDIPEVMELYLRSIIPLADYKFGSYRIPECLVTSTILGDQIDILKKGMDSPILFESSQELYINNVIQKYIEKYDDFNDAMLYSFCSSMASRGKMYKYEDMSKGIAVFVAPSQGENIVLRIPDLNIFE